MIYFCFGLHQAVLNNPDGFIPDSVLKEITHGGLRGQYEVQGIEPGSVICQTSTTRCTISPASVSF